MKNTEFNTLLSQYVYYYNMLTLARQTYNKERANYRKFAKTENQLGKPGKRLPYSPPLTMNPKSVILKAQAEKCKSAKEYLKHRQRLYEHFRNKMEKTLKENGLTIWY